MTYTYTCPHCDEELEYEFTPSRPAPCCSNHDSPAFSDPGEGAECDGPDVCGRCDNDIDIEKVIEQAEEHFANNNGPDEDRHPED